MPQICDNCAGIDVQARPGDHRARLPPPSGVGRPALRLVSEETPLLLFFGFFYAGFACATCYRTRFEKITRGNGAQETNKETRLCYTFREKIDQIDAVQLFL